MNWGVEQAVSIYDNTNRPWLMDEVYFWLTE